ncbi:MAG: M43 family zinc metalloprotease [Bacteroidia bacterium]|nr:M43 family zinc metalloprotease [Bacteroidia bacterium]
MRTGGALRTGWPDTACRPHAAYVIPVVFHIIHSGGLDSIPLPVIEAQMERIFEDFRRVPETRGFTPNGADTQIEFSLATIDPNGAPTSGVVYWRFNAPPLNWTSPKLCLSDELDMKIATGWPRDKYLNIWVVPIVCGFRGTCDTCMSSQVAGYAYYPYMSPIYADYYGSVVITTTVGATTTLRRRGRTLVHELGHNLGLAHTFEDGCGTTGDCFNEGDYVCDTPPTGQPNLWFRQQNTCTLDVPDLPDDLRNHMDYPEDPARYLFTPGQHELADYALNYSDLLPPLHEPTNLIETGTGPYGKVKARFWAESRRVLPGTPVRFHAVTAGQPHLYIWDFGGGQPDDPSSPCPTVIFPTPGTYAVRLIVQNLSGRRDTAYKANYIQVESGPWTLPYHEGWEGPTFPPSGVTIENSDAVQPHSRTWERWDTTAFPAGGYNSSRYSLRMAYLGHPHYGERDYVVTPAFDLRIPPTYTPKLSFSLSYACLSWSSPDSYLLTYSDTLRIWASPDGGGRWDLLYEKAGNSLSTHPNGCISHSGSLSGATYLPFFWRTDTIDLTGYRGMQGVRFRFEGIAGGGNMLYIDDIRVDTIRSVGTTTFETPQLHFFKNHVHLLLPSAQSCQWTLYDVVGRTLLEGSISTASPAHEFSLPESLPAGWYLLRVSGEKFSLSHPFLQLP